MVDKVSEANGEVSNSNSFKEQIWKIKGGDAFR